MGSFVAKLKHMSKSTAPTSDTDYLTTREAAELLGVALRTVQLWVEAGTLKAWKTAGGHRRIARESVDALRRQQGRMPTETRAEVSPRIEPEQLFHVLVVDDDAMMRELIVAMIRSWNLPLSVSTAEDGFAALLRIGETRPDLLITDLLMPGMDGYRMIRHLRAMPESHLIDIIAVTSEEPGQIAAKGLLPPDVPVVSKPVSFGELRSLVEQRIAGKVRKG